MTKRSKCLRRARLSQRRCFGTGPPMPCTFPTSHINPWPRLAVAFDQGLRRFVRPLTARPSCSYQGPGSSRAVWAGRRSDAENTRWEPRRGAGTRCQVAGQPPAFLMVAEPSGRSSRWRAGSVKDEPPWPGQSMRSAGQCPYWGRWMCRIPS